MTIVVDDRVLSAQLRGVGPALDGPIHTTGLWYVRLCQAVIRARGGSLSAPFADLPEPLAASALAAVLDLPPSIGLVSLRELGPTMAQLSTRHSLNLLAREALATALLLPAVIVLASTNVSPRLVAAAEAEGVDVEVLAVA